MTKTLYINIHTLWQVSDSPIGIKTKDELKEIKSLKNAYLLVENGHITEFGSMTSLLPDSDEIYDVKDGMIMPTWVDSHTHLVFATTRENEFVDRINGLSYTEIAAKGGGIHNSARKLRELPFETLLKDAMDRLYLMISKGTGAIEIKSGYGQDLENELKMLRVIKEMKKLSPIPIKASFLGAHALPLKFKDNRQGYIDEITQKMIPQVALEGLADYCDVFCEKGFFSPNEMDEILKAGTKHGLRPKIHTNQFNSMGGIEVAIANDAISVDHLEVLNDSEIERLAKSTVFATMLPGAAFFLDDPFPPARKMIQAGVKLAIATDYNPGSCPIGDMHFMISLACVKMKMLPKEVINSVTINAAHALQLNNKLGSIETGKLANLIITKRIPSIDYIPYAICSDFISDVIIKGKVFKFNED